ncbi:MAG: glycosyltransferase family 39 protein, partial [Anaerolineales bacterium]
LKAIGVAREGNYTLLGTPMSVGMWHSPLSIYLYAVPYRLSFDPRLARMFTGALNVFAVALVYVVGARYFNRSAGLIAALLYAVHPEALVATRKIWNPSLGAPFVMGFVFFSLRGYLDGKRWARLAHLPLLSLAAQTHPSTLALAPVAVMLWTHAFWRERDRRREIVFHTLVSSVLAVLLFAPWAAGLYQATIASGVPPQIDPLPNRGLGYIFDTLFILLGNWDQNAIQPIQPAITTIGALWLVWPGRWRRQGLPGLAIVMAFLLVPVSTLVLDIQYRDYHIWPSYPNAFLIQGALIAGIAGLGASRYRGRQSFMGSQLRWASALLVAAIVATQLKFFISYDRSNAATPLHAHIHAIETATQAAAEQGRDLLLIIPHAGADEYTYLQWELLSQQTPARVVWDGRALPLPVEGALLLGPTDYTGRARLSADNEELTGGFKLATLPPAAFFEPDLRPPAEIRLSNGATIVGFRSAEPGVLPQAGSLWSADMLWRYETQPDADDTVFVHVVDGHGNNYGQQDLPGLPVGQWRSGEYVLNQFHIAISPDLPASGPLFLRVGMYNDTRQAEVLNTDGNPAGGYALIQVRGSEAPAASWGAGLTLDAMTVPASQPQGPPLVVQATWRVDAPLAADTRLKWRVWDAAGRDAFYSETALAPGIGPDAIPAGAFIGAQYSLRIPTDISPGIYRLSVAPLSGSDGFTGQPFALSVPIEITLRERQFELPPAQHTLAASF